jgi:N-acetylglucosaminyldiphosphoundecaprenol N-acetyl-beta-D-mannosaminyltransferase
MDDVEISHQKRGRILKMPVDAVSMAGAIALIQGWLDEPGGRMVCAADVHMVMRHFDEMDFRATLDQADLITPDGMPLVWLLRHQGYPLQNRVCGPDLTLALCAAAEQKESPIGFYGGKPEVLDALTKRFKSQFPKLRIEYAYSPPFRLLEEWEDQAQVDAIRASGVKLLFIGLGCPKQERWIASHKSRVNAVMVGVGAAFDFHAGAIKRAPLWAQQTGLEWVFRMGSDPKRIMQRVLKYHPRFVWHTIKCTILGSSSK